MKTLVLTVITALFITGCATAWTPVKYAANQVCEATPTQQDVLAEAFDRGTYPHEVRVNCYAQVKD